METDLEYFQHRAEIEVDMAQRAVLPEATASHYELANLYLDRVEKLNQLQSAVGEEAPEAPSHPANALPAPQR